MKRSVIARMRITELSGKNLAQVVAAWNATLVHDPLTASRFRDVFLNDPNYQPDGVSVAEGDHGAVLGFSACYVRETVAGKDGLGGQWEFNWGYLKGFFVVEGDEESAIATSLLAAAEAHCAGAGKEQLRVTEYACSYVFPGLDIRYERLRAILCEHGYRDLRTLEDVAVDLRDPGLPSRLARAQRRVGTSAEVVTWRPELLPAMQAFVAQSYEPQWFPSGWEEELSRPLDHVLILRRGEEIVGWAQYHPSRPRASFGPILVLDPMRGHGYGSLLLLECMVRARQAGAERMAAGWANTGFYVANGWQITRRYAVLAKSLSGESRREA